MLINFRSIPRVRELCVTRRLTGCTLIYVIIMSQQDGRAWAGGRDGETITQQSKR